MRVYHHNAPHAMAHIIHPAQILLQHENHVNVILFYYHHFADFYNQQKVIHVP